MIIFKWVCFIILFLGFLFGFPERMINGDLNSAGIALIFLTFLIPLCPLIE